MFLRILATSALAASIAAMASVISTMVRKPAWARVWASPASMLDCSALSAVDRIMLAICSSDALVSTTEAACSLAPEESIWLADETWRAAAAVWVAARSRFVARFPRARVVERAMSHARTTAATSARTTARRRRRMLDRAVALLSSLTASPCVFLCCTPASTALTKAS